jgi:hypothetical protein
MSANTGPPQWAEKLLEQMLANRGGESIVGDLHEEYVESRLSRRGRLRANWWYLRQVASFVPWRQRIGGPMQTMYSILAVFTAACLAWFTVMEMILRHPGFQVRACVAVGLGLLSIAPLVIRRLHLSQFLPWTRLAALPLIGIGAFAFTRNAIAEDFEGYIMVISAALVFEGVLMMTVLGRQQRPPTKLTTMHLSSGTLNGKGRD